ncbi:MAG: ribonuclease Z [Chlamydiae bacterium SM23_39]|nr:MAG: ribonuclease Z [Chlamydiae bacterium SM23_39]
MSLKDVVILGCSSQQPTRMRNHGAYLVRWNEEGLLFDPGEGTQRQFIFANISPTCVTRIFVSHFHGDHCLGLGSMFMRLNLDKISHPVICYYPGNYKKNFDCLRYGCIYHENIKIIEKPVFKENLIYQDEKFKIEARFLKHGIDNIGWRITEPDKIKFKKELLKKYNVKGPNVKRLEKEKKIEIEGKKIKLEDVSYLKKGDSIAVVIDTKKCNEAVELAKNAKILICESTYLEKDKHLALKYMHMTAKQAAEIALEAQVDTLILTHFSARYLDMEAFEKEAKKIFPNTIIAEDFKRVNFPK